MRTQGLRLIEVDKDDLVDLAGYRRPGSGASWSVSSSSATTCRLKRRRERIQGAQGGAGWQHRGDSPGQRLDLCNPPTAATCCLRADVRQCYLYPRRPKTATCIRAKPSRKKKRCHFPNASACGCRSIRSSKDDYLDIVGHWLRPFRLQCRARSQKRPTRGDALRWALQRGFALWPGRLAVCARLCRPHEQQRLSRNLMTKEQIFPVNVAVPAF